MAGSTPLPWSLACSDWSVTKKMQQRSVHGTSEARSEEVMQLCLTSSDAQSGVLSHYVSKLSRYAEEAQATWRDSVVGASSRGLADSCDHCRTCKILGSRHYRAKPSHFQCHLLGLLTHRTGENKMAVLSHKVWGNCYAVIGITHTDTHTHAASTAF